MGEDDTPENDKGPRQLKLQHDLLIMKGDDFLHHLYVQYAWCIPRRGIWKIYSFCHRMEIPFSHRLVSNDVKVIHRHHKVLVNYSRDLLASPNGKHRERSRSVIIP